MRLQYFVAAEFIVVDQTTNRLSIFNVLDEIGLPSDHDGKHGVAVQNVSVVSQWIVEEGDDKRDWQVRVKIVVPGLPEVDLPSNLSLAPGKQYHRVVLSLQGMPITQVGAVLATIYLNGNQVAELSVPIVVKEIPGEAVVLPTS